MADDEEENEHRSEKHELINGLKYIIEGLLSTHSTNVWNTYGGLSRVCSQVDKILYHGLRSTQGTFGSQLDYWPFVQGLKVLNPVLVPFIEKIGRISQSLYDSSKGNTWVRECLSEHNLSTQLSTLTSDRQHLLKHYYDYAFLADVVYFKSMVICLQAVEQNKVALLAELDLGLLQKGRVTYTLLQRSESMPVRRLSGPHHNLDHPRAMTIVPPFASPKQESILCTSDEHAVPSNIGNSNSPQQNKAIARDALRTVLRKSGSESPTEVTPSDGFSFYNSPNSDPLRNIEFSLENNEPFIEENEEQSKTVLRNENLKFVQSNRLKVNHDLKPFSDRISSDGMIAVKTNCKPEEIFSDSESRSEKMENLQEKLNTSPGKKLGHKRSRSDIGVKNVTQPVNAGKGRRVSTGFQRCASSETPVKQQTEDVTVVEREGYLPRPQQGQSLIHYLSSQDFNTCANLDKENAHFSISEALIAAIEQMKWNHVISPHTRDDDEDESDEEIKDLQQRIRIRKREKLKEKGRGFPAFSDGRTDTATSHSTPSPFSSSCESPVYTDSANSSDVDNGEVDLTMSENANENTSNLSLLSSEGLSLSMASLYSDADIKKQNSTVTRENYLLDSGFICHSAESVAISLLKKFSEKQLPKASDLEWLVSERDAPQKLLPLPNSYPISPDDGENADVMRIGSLKKTRLRGNLDWAPPRPQIIFNIHPAPKRNVIMAKQNYMCAGCGTRVEQGYVKRFRYCEYLGKYFCQCCHSNSLSYVPGRILRRWDFKKYYVSNFSRELIMRIVSEPLFNLKDINSNLYRRVRALENIRDLRRQLKHLKNFLKICKLATSCLLDVEQLPFHWSDDVHTYSMNDLVLVKGGQFLTKLRNTVNSAIAHVQDCAFCQGLGFICELCQDKEVIFPFELQKVTQCHGCHACYHKQCFVPDKCPKCARIEARKLRLQTELSEELEDGGEIEKIEDG